MAAREHGEAHQLFGNIHYPVVIARRQHAAGLVELLICLGDARLVRNGDHPHPPSEDAQRVDAVERLRSRRDLHHRERATLRWTQPLISERKMIDLRLHDAGDLAMAFGTAPDLAFGPDGMLPQLLDRRMIVVGDLVGQGKVGGVERSEEHTSELKSLMRISYAVFCLKKEQSTPLYSH